MKKITICMYGAASNHIDAEYITEVEKLGEEIGKRNHKLIYGAGASGLMGACARGVEKAGGTVIGVAPRFMSAYEDINHNCTELIMTETMGDRKQVMEDNADAFVVVPGGIGTLDEFFELLTLIELGRKEAPVICYNIKGFYDNLIEFVDDCIEKGFIREKVRTMFDVCDNEKEALDIIENILKTKNDK